MNGGLCPEIHLLYLLAKPLSKWAKVYPRLPVQHETAFPSGGLVKAQSMFTSTSTPKGNPLTTQRGWPWLVFILLLSFWLGARALDVRPLWNDEWYSIYSIGGGEYGPLTLAGVWNRVATEDPWQAPGYSLVLHSWSRLVGIEPPALRAFSLLVGMLALAWTYRFAFDVAGVRAALVAGLVLATSVMFVYYLREMRVYALLTAATVYLLWIYHRITSTRRDVRRLYWLGLLLGATALLYLHYFGAFVLLAIFLYHVIFVPRNRAWVRTLLVLTASGMLFLPWLPAFFGGLELLRVDEGLSQAAISNDEILARLTVLFGNGFALLPVLTFVFALGARRRVVLKVGFLVVAIMGFILIANAALAIIPPSRLRYLLLLWPLLSVLVALGVLRASRVTSAGPVLSGGLLCLWVITGVLNSSNRDLTAALGGGTHIFPMQHISRALASAGEAGDLLVNYLPPVGNDFGIHWRSANYYFNDFDMTWLLIRSDALAYRWNERVAVPDNMIADHDRIWLSSMPGREPETMSHFIARLEAEHNLCHVAAERPDLKLGLYTRPGSCCSPGLVAETYVDYGGLIRIGLVDGLPAEAESSLTLTIGWTLSPETPLHVYSASVNLVDAAGNRVAQHDYGLEPRAFVCQTSVFDVSNLSPGSYEVQVAVYAWETGARLLATDRDGSTGDILSIGTFQVS